MASHHESIHTPEQQDAAYEQYMADYQASLENYNAARNTYVLEAVDQAKAAKAEEGVVAFPNASDTLTVALNTSAMSTECVSAGIDTFYAVATPEDTETLDTAAGHFYKYEFSKAYALIDANASSPTGRRAMRTVMDRFTFDMVGDTLTESHDRIANGDKKRVLEIYDFIRDYASSDDAQELMFTLVDEHVNQAITTEPLYADEEPVKVAANKQFIEDVASSEVSRQALRGSFDAIVFKKIHAKLGRHRYSEAEAYVRNASDETGRTQLSEYITEQKKTYVAAKIAQRRLSRTQQSEPSAAEQEAKPTIEVGQAEQARHGEDTILRNDEKRIYGVFDGMGSDAGTASEAAAKAIDAYFAHFDDKEFSSVEEGEDRMQSAFNYARDVVRRQGHGGTTTAVLAHVAEVAGTQYVFTASAGDSRMIFRDQKGNMFDMTPDQSINGNQLLNGFGPSREGWPRVADEFNAYEVVPGDQILICSDGITGDTEAQALTNEEFDDAFGQPSAQASAQRFLELSKKNDDKSVIVLNI